MSPLLKLILRRLGLGVLTLFLVSVVVFGATQALPGDPARAILGKQSADKAMYNALRAQLHLDRPIYAQYGIWLKDVVTGNMGTSTASGVSVTSLLRQRVANSALLVLFAAIISIPVSLLIGALSALWRDSVFDLTASVGSLALAALPEFVIGMLLIFVFGTTIMHVLPSVSRIDPSISVWNQLNLLILPVLTLVLAVAPYISRILRASMIEVLESDYVQMARLKGHAGAHRDVASCAAQRGDPRDPGLGPAARLARRRRGRRRVPVQLSRASAPRSSTPWPTAICRSSRRSRC